MKKLFCLFALGLIVSLVVYLYYSENQRSEARVIAKTGTTETHACFSMLLDTPLNPKSRVHTTGTGLGPKARSSEDFHQQAVLSLDRNVSTARSRSGSVARGVATTWAIWKQSDTLTHETGGGIVLKVGFIGGTSEERARVRRIVPEWSKHANVRFEFVNAGASDIRVAFDPNAGHWSYIGNSANYIDKGNKTMNLALRGERYRDAVILHEFGHALGLKHEHQNPATDIRWNENVVIRELKRTQKWSEEDIRRNVINRLNVAETNFSAFDRRSIMLYAIPNRWTIGNFETTYNTALSETDKRFIGNLYKRNTVPTQPMGRVLTTVMDHNVSQNGRKGLRIRTTFEVDRFKGQPGIVGIYFYSKNGVPLKDRNSSYLAQNGHVAVGGTFRPGYVNTIYKDYTLFIPHTELHTGSGRHDLKCLVQVFNQSTGKPLSAPSKWYYFWVNMR